MTPWEDTWDRFGPPWALYTDSGRPVAIIPAMRPGTVMDVSRMPMEHARRIVEQANALGELIRAALHAAEDDTRRCAVCGWPLAEGGGDESKGCERGDCTQRPPPERMYAPERAKREREEAGR